MENARNGAGLLVLAVLAWLLSALLDGTHYAALIFTTAATVLAIVGLVLLASGLFSRSSD